jgi:hypothetical protein
MKLQCKCSDNCACRNCRHVQELRAIALHFKNEGATEHGNALFKLYTEIDTELRQSSRAQQRLNDTNGNAAQSPQIHRG